MSDRIEEMRHDISKVYLSSGWKKKVANMPDKQVMAIYYNFLERGMFGHVPRPRSSQRELQIHKPIEPVVEPMKYFASDQAQQLAFDL